MRTPDQIKAKINKVFDKKLGAAGWLKSLVFTETTGGTFNPVTGAVTGGTVTTYTYQAISQAMDIKQWEGYDIAVTDLPVTYTRIDSFKPSVEQSCTFDGLTYQVVAALYDPAGATAKLVLRLGGHLQNNDPIIQNTFIQGGKLISSGKLTNDSKLWG